MAPMQTGAISFAPHKSNSVATHTRTHEIFTGTCIVDQWPRLSAISLRESHLRIERSSSGAPHRTRLNVDCYYLCFQLILCDFRVRVRDPSMNRNQLNQAAIYWNHSITYARWARNDRHYVCLHVVDFRASPIRGQPPAVSVVSSVPLIVLYITLFHSSTVRLKVFAGLVVANHNFHSIDWSQLCCRRFNLRYRYGVFGCDVIVCRDITIRNDFLVAGAPCTSI